MMLISDAPQRLCIPSLSAAPQTCARAYFLNLRTLWLIYLITSAGGYNEIFFFLKQKMK